jgi:hypothetical protein
MGSKLLARGRRIRPIIEVDWKQGNPPKDRRLLLLGTPQGIPQANLELDIVVGHWHEANNVFVPVEVPYPRAPTRPALNVKWWAEIPNLPERGQIAHDDA